MDHYTSVTIITDIVAILLKCVTGTMTVKKSLQTNEGKKNCSKLKGDIGMEVYYLCQRNTYVIDITAAHQIHEQLHRCWVDIGSIPPFLCPLFYLEQIFLPSLVQ